MKQKTTDQLLILGMALKTDKRAMEQRVRGVFARKRSTGATIGLAALLTLSLLAGAFTTACQPGEAQAARFSAIPTEAPQSANNADAGDATAQTADARYAVDNLTEGVEATRARILRTRDLELESNAAFPAPRLSNSSRTERGEWSARQNVVSAKADSAKLAFLSVANSLFDTAYQPDDLAATYYTDKTGNRPDVWRLDSADGVLNGALEANTLVFLSAQCKTIPQEAMHESIVLAGKSYDTESERSLLNSSAAVSKVASALGASLDPSEYNAYQTSYNVNYGWGVCENVQFYLDNGRFCSANLFGDERLTLYAVGVYADIDCFLEGVYWRADLEWTRKTNALVNPIDFRGGKPGAGDSTREQAIAIYTALLTAAGYTAATPQGALPEPTATFYVDYSGARENFWNLRTADFSINIGARTGHIFDVIFKGQAGLALSLPEPAFTDSVEAAYTAQTKRLLEAVFGEGSVKEALFESISDDTNAAVTCEMTDGARYDVFYSNRTICLIDYLAPYTDGDVTQLYPNWVADFRYQNSKTGEIYLSINQ